MDLPDNAAETGAIYSHHHKQVLDNKPMSGQFIDDFDVRQALLVCGRLHQRT